MPSHASDTNFVADVRLDDTDEVRCWVLFAGSGGAPTRGWATGKRQRAALQQDDRERGKLDARAEGCVAQPGQCAGDMLRKLHAMQQRHGLAIAAWLLEQPINPTACYPGVPAATSATVESSCMHGSQHPRPAQPSIRHKTAIRTSSHCLSAGAAATHRQVQAEEAAGECSQEDRVAGKPSYPLQR